ncbi:hypothetical protein KIPB_015783, partial [Kipferlia bialata]|eukprot:g15783.t1
MRGVCVLAAAVCLCLCVLGVCADEAKEGVLLSIIFS